MHKNSIAVETFYFSHARTALKYGLKSLGLQAGDQILVPDFICEVVLHPLEQLGLLYHFYPILDDLSPNWDKLEKKVTTGSKALLMVHYFGQPQNISAFQSFCEKHHLYLIEDNAHGHGGTLDSHQLGCFGDIGFSSPRKQLLLASGGVLYRQGVMLTTPEELPKIVVSKFKERLRHLLRRFPGWKAWLRRMFSRTPNFADPCAFPEFRIGQLCADDESARRISEEDWKAHAAARREAWKAWNRFAVDRGLRPVWSAVHSESCPWAMPVYAPNPEERIRWLHWGWLHGDGPFPWPTLPEPVLRSSPSALNRWQHLLCFPLHQKPQYFH